ncbi:MAG TPA: hypothetical protein VK177_18575 [Flavobacteriales bacterium]|nr:hypothetical protein [Flavobacteriales bacterium]
MKKLILALTVVLFASNAFAQSTLKPAINSTKPVFKQEGNTSTTLFSLNATSAEIENLKTQAGTLPNVKFSADKQKGDVYNCKLVITDRNETTYVQRIFGFFGFSAFTLDGQEKELTDLGNTLGKLK